MIGRVLAGFLLLPLPALAEGTPPAPPAPKERTLDLDLATARVLMKGERWTDAVRALRKVFEDYEGNPEVIRRIADIEEDLKLCTYRAQEPPPPASALFGPGAKTFDPVSRRLVLEFPEGAAAEGWKPVEGGFRLLPLRFDEVTFEFEADFSGEVTFVLSWDPDAKSGYVVVPGFSGAKRFQPAVILRVEGEKKTELARESSPDFGEGVKRGKVVRTPGGISVTVGGASRIAAQDSRVKRGYPGVKAPSMKGLVVRGTAEAVQAKSVLGAYYDRRYREWAPQGWKREAALPAWVLGQPAAEGSRPRLDLPADAPAVLPGALAEALECWRLEDPEGFLRALPKAEGLPPVTGLLLEGLASFAAGRILDGERLFTEVLAKQAGCGTALLYRGLGRLRRRDLDGARADLEAARAAAGAQPDLWMGLAHLAIAEGNLEAAHRALSEGRTRGAADASLARFEAFVRRSLRGPAWTKRFEARGRYATVASDHSQALADQVLKAMDEALANCVALFPRGTKPPVPVRVFLFASREGFLGYAGDLGRDMDSFAGAYLPQLHEMVLFVPEVSRDALFDTVRHESFHAFVHGFLEDVPTWLDEGWAQCLGKGKVDVTTIRMASLEPEALARIGERPDVEAFLALDHGKFMAGAERNYPTARALVTFLYEGEFHRHRERLAGYLEALRTGLSPKEAFEKQFRPVLAPIADGFAAWLKAGGKGAGL